MKKLFYLTIPLVFAIVFIPFSFSSAHVTGASWEKIVDDYKIDVGYDPTTIVATQPQRFDFNILDPKTGEVVDFSDVWVRISSGQDTVFASGIHRPTFGLSGMIFEFPSAGSYDLNVRFEKDDNTIVQTDLPVTVVAASVQQSASTASRSSGIIYIIFGAMAGIVLGVAAYFILRKTHGKS